LQPADGELRPLLNDKGTNSSGREVSRARPVDKINLQPGVDEHGVIVPVDDGNSGFPKARLGGRAAAISADLIAEPGKGGRPSTPFPTLRRPTIPSAQDRSQTEDGFSNYLRELFPAGEAATSRQEIAQLLLPLIDDDSRPLDARPFDTPRHIAMALEIAVRNKSGGGGEMALAAIRRIVDGTFLDSMKTNTSRPADPAGQAAWDACQHLACTAGRGPAEMRAFLSLGAPDMEEKISRFEAFGLALKAEGAIVSERSQQRAKIAECNQRPDDP
jgi:hypothetical protein